MIFKLTGSQWDLLINGVGLLGIVLLAIPAIYANKYAKLLADVGNLNPASPQLRKKLVDTREKLKQLQENWTPGKANALIFGTALAALSYVLALIKALVM